MWDGLFMLLTLSTIMGIASFLAGILPLSFSLSHRQLRFIAFLGTGVLVGTSMIVIIPEGIETLYSTTGKGHAHKHRSVEVQQAPNPGPRDLSEIPQLERMEAVVSNFIRGGSIKAPTDIIVERTPEDKPAKNPKPDPAKHDPNGGPHADDDSTEGQKEGHDRTHPPEKEDLESGHDDDDKKDPHAYVGVSLVLGFILMYLVDVLPEALSPSKPTYQPLQISLSDLSRGPHNASTATLNASPPPEPVSQPRSSATTIGLVIHACADGIALGASSTAPSTSLSLIIFIAIMLHKAPAAFGLTSVLLKQGLSKRTARTHLLLFSLAAPAGALATWAVVHLLGRSTLGGDDGLTWATGCVLLFSGGTFLYVAMHSMNETNSPSHSHDSTSNGYADPGYGKKKDVMTKGDIATAVVGMLLPLITQVGHVH